MAEFLLELFSEEIPARMQAQAAADLKRLVCERLKDAGLTWTRADAYATPRRLALVIDGLPTQQPDTVREEKGPRADAPPQAIEGFLKKTGLTRDQVEIRETDKGAVLFAVVKKAGGETVSLLADIIPDVIRNFPWPKSQRWGSGALRWVRPLKNIACVLDGNGIAIKVVDLQGNQMTFGHRFLAPATFPTGKFVDYKRELEKAFVLLDPAERAAKIWVDAERLAAEHHLEVIEDKALLAEVAGLVEWPVVLMGDFDKDFLEVPAECLTATMRANQKYFSLRSAKTGKLSNHFIVVANTLAKDGGQAIIAGNERVLRARLSDAKFFWDQDLKIPLADRLPALDGIVFHAKLGTVGDRVARLKKLAAHLAPMVDADPDLAHRAAELAKADLTSGMVGEFPELQGIMGRYYALAQGEPETVANAIAEHYSPLGPGDNIPTDPVSIAVALAEKIDTIVGFFGIQEKPTGSKDPFAIRRAALGVIRIIIENELRLNLARIFDFAANHFDHKLTHHAEDILAFFADRLKVYLREQGVRHDLISAAFSVGGEDNLVRLLARVEALKGFIDSDDGRNLLAAFRRAANILKIEEKKDGKTYIGTPQANRLVVAEELALARVLETALAQARSAVAAEDWSAAMAALAMLRAPIDAFFDKVTVNDTDTNLRHNRLLLLSQFRSALGAVADFSLIEG